MNFRAVRMGLVLGLALLAGQIVARGIVARVVDPDGQALTGIVVTAYGPRDALRGVRSELARTSSGPLGAFRVGRDDADSELLTLEGPLGVGRVKLGPDLPADGVVSYPVRTTVVLLHDNDLHFNANHTAQFRAEIARIRREHRNVFLLNAGDLFIRTPAKWNVPTKDYYAERSRTLIDWMNATGYDAATLGNHDLDYVDDLTKAALLRAKFPLLAANITVTTDRLPQPRPWTVLTTENDLTVAVLGLSTVNFKKSGVAMRDVAQTFAEHSALADRHQVFVALTHLGFPFDQVLARSTQGLDVIIGGHCHTLLPEAVLANGVLIAHAGGTAADRPNPVDPSRPKYLGCITLELENDRIVRKAGKVLTFQ